MKLYTKTGDKGQTGLIGGTRVDKDDVRIEAYGTVDELNAHVGMLVSMQITDENKVFLQQIQYTLFTVGSYLATDLSKTKLKHASVVSTDFIEQIENEIDRIDEKLPALNYFVLPGGSVEASQCHICRTVTRRAERRIAEMNKNYNVDNNVITYINRLSDYFFALSRYVIQQQGKKEIYWK